MICIYCSLFIIPIDGNLIVTIFFATINTVIMDIPLCMPMRNISIIYASCGNVR